MYNTLIDVLISRKSLDTKGITFIHRSDFEEFLSYKELYVDALRSLAYLQSKGIDTKQELVFQIEDNRTFITVFWACILGGIIPVPLTLGQNDDHKQKLYNVWEILSNPSLVISSASLAKVEQFANDNGLNHKFKEMDESVIYPKEILSCKSYGDVIQANEDDIAFIQFSSGSTGNPKGVVLTHKNLLVNMASISHGGRYTSDDSMLSWMPLTHDMGLIGFHLNPLFCGMNQFILPTNLFVRRPSIWLHKASEHGVNILCSPNFGYSYILKHCGDSSKYQWDLSNIRIIFNGAEPISEPVANDFLELLSIHGLNKTAMCPVYGLAEASLAVTMSNVEDEMLSCHLDRSRLNLGDNISITLSGEQTITFVNVGKPVKDCFVKIVDEANKELDEESIGHIQISGDNVTSGYYNNPVETKKTKINDQWLRTGDLGFMKGGCLFITGRAKDIIFINGQNYYPHDIERVAENVEFIELNKIAVTSWYNDNREQQEVIAFVFHRGGLDKFIPTLESLRSLISIRMNIDLDRIIPVREMPRTTSGKLQRFRLLQKFTNGDFDEQERELHWLLKQYNSSNNRLGAQNDLERKVLVFWKQVLGHSNIGVTDNFFEVGGNSLKAAELGMMFLKEFNVELPLSILLERSTVRKLASVLSELKSQQYNAIPKADFRDRYPLTTSQAGIFYYWELDKQSIAYNIPVVIELQNSIDSNVLKKTIDRLIERHDALRMSLNQLPEPYFSINDRVEFKLQEESVDRDDLDELLKSLVKPFDLSKPPLFRIVLIETLGEEYFLFMDFHHIIADGISVNNFVKELFNLYYGKSLSIINTSFADYAIFQSDAGQHDEPSYWQAELKHGLPVLELPTDFSRPLMLSGKGGRTLRIIDAGRSEKIRSMAKKCHCTSHAFILSIYYILLAKYTQQDEFALGIPVAGRLHPDITDTQGMFVNSLPLVMKVTGGMSFFDFLQQVKKKVNQTFAHQNYPYNNLIQMIRRSRDISRNPLFDSMFIYQNMTFPKLDPGENVLSRHFFDPEFSKFDLSLEVFDCQDTFHYSFEYSTDLFKKTSIERLQEHFDNLIDRVLFNPKELIAELQILSEEEVNNYLVAYNTTKSEYPSEKCIHQLFEEQVEMHPKKLAIEYDGKSLSFSELNKKVNVLANHLRNEGVGQ
ncbi:condensation domain-containing protein, partial [Fulvivirga kasyanovii]